MPSYPHDNPDPSIYDVPTQDELNTLADSSCTTLRGAVKKAQCKFPDPVAVINKVNEVYSKAWLKDAYEILDKAIPVPTMQRLYWCGVKEHIASLEAKLDALAAHKAQPVRERPCLEECVACGSKNLRWSPSEEPGLSRWHCDSCNATGYSGGAQPVADVRGMVEVLERTKTALVSYGAVLHMAKRFLSSKHLMASDAYAELNQAQCTLRDITLKEIDAALASARHAMGGEGS